MYRVYSIKKVDIFYCCDIILLVMLMIKITSVRNAYPENAGVFIDRKNGHPQYTFLHFYNSVELKVGDAPIITTAPHAVILFKPDTPQYFKSHEPLIHDWFHFVCDEGDLPQNTIEADSIFYPNNFDYITKTVAQLETEFFGEKKNADILMDLKVKELFVMLDRMSNNEQIFVSTETIERFRYLRGEVFSTLDGDWSVANMAKRLNLSQSRFYSLYKTIYGISPTADLINAKMNSAKTMLTFGHQSVESIALSLGYKNITHFIRQFKASTGMSPSAYRKLKSP